MPSSTPGLGPKQRISLSGRATIRLDRARTNSQYDSRVSFPQRRIIPHTNLLAKAPILPTSGVSHFATRTLADDVSGSAGFRAFSLGLRALEFTIAAVWGTVRTGQGSSRVLIIRPAHVYQVALQRLHYPRPELQVAHTGIRIQSVGPPGFGSFMLV